MSPPRKEPQTDQELIEQLRADLAEAKARVDVSFFIHVPVGAGVCAYRENIRASPDESVPSSQWVLAMCCVRWDEGERKWWRVPRKRTADGLGAD